LLQELATVVWDLQPTDDYTKIGEACLNLLIWIKADDIYFRDLILFQFQFC